MKRNRLPKKAKPPSRLTNRRMKVALLKIIGDAYTGIYIDKIKQSPILNKFDRALVFPLLRELRKEGAIILQPSRGWRINPTLPLSASEWRQLRIQIYNRDKGICQHCRKRIPFKEVHIDHIKPLSLGGNNRPLNLRTLCQTCHALRDDKAHLHMRNTFVKQGKLTKKHLKKLW